MKTRLLCLVAALALGACGSAKNGNYAGEPLASIRGTLSGIASETSADEIHLAVAWYPYRDNLLPNQPPAIVSDSVSYQGQFPISYTFNLMAPPPETAFTTIHYQGKTFREAIGVLLAYRDLDHDGQLATIPSGGAPKDALLGASVSDVTDWFVRGAHVILYADGDLPDGLPAGYSLLEDGAPVSLDTPVPVSVSDESDLGLLLCEQLFTFPQVAAAPGSVCATTPRYARLRVYGSIRRYGSVSSIDFDVEDGIHELRDAQVSVNGTALTFDEQFGQYLDDTQAAAVEGSNTFSVQSSLGSVDGSITVPAGPSLLAPVDGASVSRGQPLSVSWSPVDGITDYQVEVWDVSQSDYGPMVYENNVPGTSVATSPLDFTGNGVVHVSAEAQPFQQDDVYVEAAASDAAMFTVTGS